MCETRRRARQRYGKRRYAEDLAFRAWTLKRNAQNRRLHPVDIWYRRYWFKHAPIVKWRNHKRWVMKRSGYVRGERQPPKYSGPGRRSNGRILIWWR